MSHNCENCRLRAHFDMNPGSFLGKLWRWHINFCPGWKAYYSCLTEERKTELRSKYNFNKH